MFILQANASAELTNSVFQSRMDISDFILLAISLAILAAWVLAIWYILRWALLLILSGGKEDKITPAINTIRYALIWLIVSVITIFIFPKVAWLLWLDATKFASPEKIFFQIKVVWDKIFWPTDTFNPNSSSTNFSNDIDSLPADFSDL